MDRSLHAWAEKFDRIHMPEKKGKFDTDIRSDFGRISAMGLPTYDRLILNPEEFLENIKQYEETFRYQAYYSQVYPQVSGLGKFNLMNFSALSELVPFLYEKLGRYMNRYTLLISEFEENVYGGSMMSDGTRVFIDITEGLQNQISYGNGAAYSCIAEDSGEVIFKDSYACSVVLLFEEILDSVIVLGSDSRMSFLPGYFEFAFTRKDKGDMLRLVFFDYKTDMSFYI